METLIWEKDYKKPLTLPQLINELSLINGQISPEYRDLTLQTSTTWYDGLVGQITRIKVYYGVNTHSPNYLQLFME